MATSTPTPIYRDYDQAALDLQFDTARRQPEIARLRDAHAKDHAADNADALGAAGCRRNIAYGADAKETLDFFATGAAGAPLLVFIHGGYWKSRDKEDFARLAPAWTDAGVNFVSLNYPLCPTVRIDDVVAACRGGVAWLWDNALEFGFDAARIFVAGHSAGAHLAVMTLATDWQSLGDYPDNLVKGATAISGLYDLQPLRLSFHNVDFGLDAAEAERNSPVRQVPSRAGPLILTVGECEGDEFVCQTNELAMAWRRDGLEVTVTGAPGLYHFNIADKLCEPGSPLNDAVTQQIAGKTRGKIDGLPPKA